MKLRFQYLNTKNKTNLTLTFFTDLVYSFLIYKFSLCSINMTGHLKRHNNGLMLTLTSKTMRAITINT